ncbi:MAG: sugar ABC transporter ATP-binding protein [Clostridiales bacterium]|nr:sugar ABC transporter ATP-binding protein [Clostridiales bacterium]
MTGKTIDQLQEYRPRKPLGEKILEVDNLNGVNFKNISFDLKAGEILGLAGLVGSGRTEITKTIFGTLKKKSGSVRLFGNELKKLQPDSSVSKGLVYLPEERKSEGIFPNLDVKENSTIIVLNKLVRLGLISFKQENKITKNMIKNFNVKVDKLSTKILNLSGGNQQKVLIGRVMESKPRIIIFDEPTRGIDVGSKEEIYKIMQYLAEELRTGIIFISSELEELIRCCNRIISMYNGEKMLESSGDEITTENILSAILGINNNQHQEVTRK